MGLGAVKVLYIVKLVGDVTDKWSSKVVLIIDVIRCSRSKNFDWKVCIEKS